MGQLKLIQQNLGKNDMPDSVLDTARDKDLSKMEPMPSWNMKYLQRGMTQTKDGHKIAAE